jgi:tRNA(fMet)-specific endonuclease VapC
MSETLSLDTNVAIAAINRRLPVVRRHLEAALASGTSVVLSAIVLHELHYGIAKSDLPDANNARLSALLSFLLSLGIMPWSFEPEDAREAGEIRARLERAGTPIGPYDLLIAGQARRRGATLVTANEREFARVPGLKTENWSK